jgi:cation diffusion facilitator family transporter
MITLLARLFIKNHREYGDPKVRGQYGVLSSIAAIVFNILLFAAKYAVGVLSGSVSILADAFNNLADAAGSFLLLLGFRFAGLKPAPDRPFGHGRIEYVAGLVVSGLILVTAVQMGRDSIAAIVRPAPPVFRWAAVLVLGTSVAVKFYMSFFTRSIAQKIDSSAMRAAAADYMSDTLSTFVVLLCLFIYRWTGLNLDGWGGLFVALFILRAGLGAGWETLRQLLGKPPEPELVKRIEEIVMSFDDIIGIHDRAMNRLDEELGGESVIHMDPIDTGNRELAALREEVTALATAIDERIDVHDFRMVPGHTHTNLIFDILIPFRMDIPDEELKERLCRAVRERHPDYHCVMHIDRPYV